MKIKIVHLILLAFLVSIFLTHCEDKKRENTVGVISFVKGKAVVERNSKKTDLKYGEKVWEGDKIFTYNNSVLVLVFHNDLGEMEIQSNTVLTINSLLKQIQSIQVQKGSVWTRITKLGKGNEFYLHTPTSVASVRGTKFYTFQIGAYQGTCHCEGQIQLELKDQEYNKVNLKDILVFYKDKKNVVINPEDWKPPKSKEERHRHSQIDNSPLGQRNNLTKVESDMLLKTIDGLFQK
ncbi:MAG: FecR family protein [Leptospiraceae bacterium]|nr:FecR domain-containing protein [Leptospiraceae bacterium]MCK6380245.1 FecR family protein [Leptospiraceae bacterium]NUM42550.1 FecR domain-containing protein [Leptospiraceae bacterium]